jgi:hypothetical protein
MDAHARNGIYDSDHATYFHFVPGMYSVPFRTLYSKDIDNLFICGRIHSATHLAMSSTRVICTCAAGGQAAGTAAFLCKKYNVTPRDITQKHIKELQNLLVKDDQTILGIPNTDGVALLDNAEIKVSSVKKYENYLDTRLMALDRDYCLVLPYEGTLDSVDIGVKNKEAAPVSLTVEIYGGSRLENYMAEQFLKKISVEVPGAFDGYLTVPVNAAPLHGNCYFYICNKQRPG